jgi:hypothetical protein
VAVVFQGTGTRADKVYLVEKCGQSGGLVRVLSSHTGEVHLLERHFLKPALRGRSIARYGIDDEDRLQLIVPYELRADSCVAVSEERLRSIAPRTLAYLKKCKPRLDEREDGRFKHRADWYAYGYPRSMTRFDRLKIVIPDVCNRGKCWLEDRPHWLIDTAYGLLAKDGGADLHYLLALLNSPMLTYFLKETGTPLRGGYFRMKTAYLDPFPIPDLDLSHRVHRTQHDRVVELVGVMLRLHKELRESKTASEQESVRAQIAATDGEIDRLVYDLYGLTEDEIAIVEGRR